ncbi:acyl-CoA dehydrogenase [Paenibacillus xylanexedens]|uniref:acyl-CoA dehydrogenase family protein n=1 Tax=Paenibacillus xylanexedens TaxID=528191 RepID=UPI000938380C|nr:acyl-CoA dehydrogenase family protein [Paenibacillus xylanexedens]APO47191.1 acyl-CoA dehydrogenase [Paenibacillus xylanexedens]
MTFTSIFLDEAKEFSECHIRPIAKQMDEKEAISLELVTMFAQKGYLSLPFSEKFGGKSMSPVQYGLFIEEIGKACCTMRTLLTVQTSLVGETLAKYGSEEQQNKWLTQIITGKGIGAFALTEPEIGSDASQVKTTYENCGKGYKITGKKKWISFGDIANFFIVIAQNAGKVSAFIIDKETEGVTTSPIKGLLAGRATHIAEITFDQVLIPKENLIGPEGGGFSFVVNSALDQGRYSVAWGGVAIAQECLEQMVRYACSRTQFSTPIINHQLIQKMIGDAITEINAARAFCKSVGGLRQNNDWTAIEMTGMAKYFASKVAVTVSSDALQIHGGNGFYNEYSIERLFREAKVLEVIEGTSQIQQQSASKFAIQVYGH